MAVMHTMEKRSILVVDDDSFLLRTLAGELEDQGYAVATAPNGERALKLLEDQRFELIVTDMVMPGVDGITVLEKAKKQCPNTMVVILTGYGDMASAIASFRLEADDYIVKPCGYDEFFYRIRRCFEKMDLRRAVSLGAQELAEMNRKLLQQIGERQLVEKRLRESEMELRSLSRQLLSAGETERKRIAHELHDGVGQALTAIKYSAEISLKKLRKSIDTDEIHFLENIVTLTQGAIKEVRHIIKVLRPTVLDDLGVIAILSDLCREFIGIYSHIEVQKEIIVQEAEIPLFLKTTIFRIVQEALNNVAKHSRASRLVLRLGKKKGVLMLEIVDNGIGIQKRNRIQCKRSRHGFGIAGIRERVKQTGGICAIENVTETGTAISVCWPLDKIVHLEP
jgi:signal transduction histidine kinase